MSRRVVIVGGGVAALEAALALRALAAEHVEVELIAPESDFSYRPLAVAEPFDLGTAMRFELSGLVASAGAIFSPGTVTRVDAGRRIVQTSAGSTISYDWLLIACGAVPIPAVIGALTFRGSADSEKMRRLLAELRDESVERVAFVVPWGVAWSLPVYELALMTAADLAGRGLEHVEVTLVTPEDAPLQLFGSAASEAVRTLLDERGIAVHTGAAAVELAEGELRLLPTGTIPADWAVALPRLHGPRIDGIPQTVDGFVSVDAHGRVRGAPDIFAAGDITTFPIKQGGIAAQQADAAAEMIALNAGAELVPEPFRPVLRGLLLTGTQPRYLRQSPAGGSIATAEPLWWPPTKIVGRYLAPFLALVAGVESPPEAPSIPGAVEVDRELELERIEALATLRLESRDSDDDTPSVGSVMTTEFLVAAPEDTLGEVAERMSEQVARPALVSDHGVLIGILTSRDLLRAFAARVHPSDARVREWMTAEPVVVSSGTPLETAVTLMGQYDLNHLPVVDDERPVGILSLRQAVRRTRGGIGVGLGF